MTLQIKEVTELTGLSIDTIRYYERIGIVMPIDRQENGVRDFSPRTIRQLLFAKRMREAGLSIEALKEYIDLLTEDDDRTIPARKTLLTDEADRLETKVNNLQETLKELRHKVEIYETHMRMSEKQFIED
ncbi:MAG TPA: MerR family transcriptional regulator [Lactobacillaceae bacterium]|jgi:DNA-binding transcriptional MerR regulator